MKNVKKKSSNNIIPFKLLIGLLRTVATNGTTFTFARIYQKIHKINDSFVLFFGATENVHKKMFVLLQLVKNSLFRTKSC